MENKEKKNPVKKAVEDMSSHAKTQHEITKTRHQIAMAPQPGFKDRLALEKEKFKERHQEAIAPQPSFKEKFEIEKDLAKERHQEAKLPPLKKQQKELAELKEKQSFVK